jgi:hypothetical protein
MVELIEAGARSGHDDIAADALARLAGPVPRPRKVFAKLGINSRSHLERVLPH